MLPEVEARFQQAPRLPKPRGRWELSPDVLQVLGTVGVAEEHAVVTPRLNEKTAIPGAARPLTTESESCRAQKAGDLPIVELSSEGD